MTAEHPPTIADVLQARARLRGRIRHTPLEPSPALSAVCGAEVLLKLENLQRTGSFKCRGATNAAAMLAERAGVRHLVTASAGNHGLGLALAARSLGAAATVFVPTDGSQTKRRRIAALGAEVRTVAGGYDEAHAEAEAFAEQTRSVYVHAFSDPAVVAGQGTVGLEVVEARPDVRQLLIPVGGGGLIGGIGVVARALAPGARVVGVQSTTTAAMHASLRAGAVVSPPYGATLCDGLSGDIDQRSLDLARTVVDEVLLVDEAAVRDAMRFFFREEGLVAEGSAAVVVAALLQGRVPSAGPVAAVITGGNVDASSLVPILQEAA